MPVLLPSAVTVVSKVTLFGAVIGLSSSGASLQGAAAGQQQRDRELHPGEGAVVGREPAGAGLLLGWR